MYMVELHTYVHRGDAKTPLTESTSICPPKARLQKQMQRAASWLGFIARLIKDAASTGNDVWLRLPNLALAQSAPPTRPAPCPV